MAIMSLRVRNNTQQQKGWRYMKILITGASGMVGRQLLKLIPSAHSPTSAELDLINPSAVMEYMKRSRLITLFT